MRRWPALLAIAIGLAIAMALIGASGAREVATRLAHAGWWLPLVIALHLPQVIFSALGWRSLIADPRRPGFMTLVGYRWIREAVNALLPVAQLGGDVVRARLLALKGVTLAYAAASCTVDLTMELASQVAFSALGVGLLLAAPHGPEVARLAIGATGLGALLAAGLVGVQRGGGLDGVVRRLTRLAERRNWWALGGMERFGPAVSALYRDPRRLGAAFFAHLASWLLGALETYAALAALGLHPSLRETTVIESLGQIVRALGFAIPGALGVQEGGYVLVCALFAIAPQAALALSLIRRIRELVLGVPGLVAWHRIEARSPSAKTDARSIVAPIKAGG